MNIATVYILNKVHLVLNRICMCLSFRSTHFHEFPSWHVLKKFQDENPAIVQMHSIKREKNITM